MQKNYPSWRWKDDPSLFLSVAAGKLDIPSRGVAFRFPGAGWLQ